MPVMQNIVLKDAATPPVNHTFNPMSLRNDLGTYVDKSGGAIKTRPAITISVRPASPGNQGHKVTVKLTLPHVVAAEDGTCCTPPGAAVPFSQVSIETLRNSVSSDADNATLLSFLADLVKDPQFVAVAGGESLR